MEKFETRLSDVHYRRKHISIGIRQSNSSRRFVALLEIVKANLTQDPAANMNSKVYQILKWLRNMMRWPNHEHFHAHPSSFWCSRERSRPRHLVEIAMGPK